MGRVHGLCDETVNRFFKGTLVSIAFLVIILLPRKVIWGRPLNLREKKKKIERPVTEHVDPEAGRGPQLFSKDQSMTSQVQQRLETF